MKLWHAMVLLNTFLLCACACSIIAIFVVNWRAGVVEAWVATSLQTQRDITAVINDNLNFLKFAARSLPVFIPQLPLKDFDPTELSHIFNAYDIGSVYTFTSLGIIRKAPNTTNGKLSWQLAAGFGCLPYMYAYSDALINPIFVGYCDSLSGYFNSTAPPAYTGIDWGLKPEEAELVAETIPYTFLPIFNLLSQFTLTYEMVGWVNNFMNASSSPIFGVSFAEMDLRLFSEYVANNISARVTAYVMETQTSAMIASMINNTVVNTTLARQYANTSTSLLIRETFNYAIANPNVVDGYVSSSAGGGWRVTSSRYQDTGLDWTVVVVIPNGQIYDSLEFSIIVASVISFSVIIIAIVAMVLINVCCIRKSFMRLAQTLRIGQSDGGHVFTEFRDLQTEINDGNTNKANL